MSGWCRQAAYSLHANRSSSVLELYNRIFIVRSESSSTNFYGYVYYELPLFFMWFLFLKLLFVLSIPTLANVVAGTSRPGTTHRASGPGIHTSLNYEPYKVTTMDHSIITVEGDEKRLLMLGMRIHYATHCFLWLIFSGKHYPSPCSLILPSIRI